MRATYPLLLLASGGLLAFGCSKSSANPTGASSSSSSSHASTSSSSGGTGGSGGSGGAGGSGPIPFTGPASWNAAVTPPSDTTAAAQRAACAYKAGDLPAATTGASYPMGSQIPIDHIVIVMMENRSFDQYFSQLAAYGPTDANLPPANYANVGPDGGTVTPYHDNVFCLADTDHSWAASHRQYNNGLMDGFWLTNEGSQPANPANCGPSISCNLPPNPPAGTDPNSGMRALAYYDANDLPFYYWMTTQFAIADNYHAALLGPTWPNREYMYAATSRGQTANNLVDYSVQPRPCTTNSDCTSGDGGADAGQGGTCFNQSGCTNTCKVDSDCGPDAPQGTCDLADGGVCTTYFRTIFDYMEERGITWKVYASTFEQGTPGWAITVQPFLKYNTTHQFTNADYLADAAAGTLPNVAFVDPDLGDENYQGQDEHPAGMPQTGQNFTAGVIDALVKSPAWGSSALFLTYDEHGGHWDHAVPPPACPPDDIAPILLPTDPPGGFDIEGIRVPLTVVSPYAKKHYVSHVQYDHTSILRFIEARFSIGALTARDANAMAPFDMFDFANKPNATPPTITIPPVDNAGLAACAVLWDGPAPDAGSN